MRNQILGNRYRVLERIGEGGMAFVYVAMDEKLGRKVAIKVLHEHMEKNPDIRKRFQLEAQAVSSLEHPNIVKIYDFSGDHSDRLWIVTEVIRGKNLAQYVQQFTGGWLHPIISAAVVREILKALDKAHSTAIVHRDVKPENIMLTVEGRVKLMDFGIAKDLGKSGMTMTGTFMGSPSYMSPEQIRGRDVDLRSDLYSLSVLFYEIVTGRLPYTGQTTHDVVMKIMEGEFTYPKYIVPALPESLNAMIVRGMSKDPGHRFQTARDYGAELDRFMSEMGFDESHIELERYFKDRAGFEERLASSKAALLPTSTMALRLGRTGAGQRATQTIKDRAKTVPPPQATHQIPTPPARSPFKVDDTWQKHVPTARTGMHSPAASRTMAPGADSQRAPTVALRQPTQALYHPELAAPANNRAAAVPVAEPVIAQRPAQRPFQVRRRRTSARPARTRDSWLGYVFGIILVGMLSGVSIWGFWEVSSRVGNVKQSGVTTSEGKAQTTKKQRKKRDGTPVTIKSVSKKATIPTVIEMPRRPERPEKVERPERTGRTERVETTPKTTKRRPLKLAQKDVRVMPPSDVGNPNVSVENVEIRVGKKQPVQRPTPDASGQDPEPAEQTTPAPAAPAPAPSPAVDAGGKGRFMISSQPAAEVYVDGRRLGTTVDNTSNSGWLSVSSGSHSLELRRQGYVSYKTRFEVGGDEQKTLPRVDLTPAGGGETASADSRHALTLRVNLFPAQVTIRNLDDGNVQAFVMKSTSKTVQLPAGRYKVRIDREGQTKERELGLAGGGQLTFSADFKDE